MPSKRRVEAQKKRKAAKKLRQKQKPQSESKYARKKRGDYPPNSPYRSEWAAYA